MHAFDLNIITATSQKFDRSLYPCFSKDTVLEQHRKVYFHSDHFACRSLCFDLFILISSFLAFCALALALELFTRNQCLQVLGLRMSRVA